MKKVGYLLFASALVALGGCSDDTFEQTGGTPAKVGDEITFGSSLNDVAVRTVYSDRPVNGAYIVSWEKDGSDQIAIYCPEASNGTLVKYSVMPDATDSTHSSTVTKVNADEAGLQWGNAPTHHFYGFYPASRVTGTEDGKIRGTVPTTQNVRSWNVTANNHGGQNYYGKTNTDNAYMWAYGAFNREEMGGQDVPLTFHPWMTVLEIKIPGPEDGSTKTVTNVNIRAIEGTQTALAGEFICDMTPVEEAGQAGTMNESVAPNYEPVTQGEVTNTISISGYMPDEGNYVTLTQGDTMIVRAYLLPIDEQDATNARNIQISVATLNGAALNRTLGYSGHGENSVQPHKVNTVILPPLVTEGTNYWMSQLDKDVYYSELSLPGSKMSYLTAANNANPVYQGADIRTQFLDGVRAFIVQVGADVQCDRTGRGTIFNPYEYTFESATLPVVGSQNQTLANTIEDLAAELEQAETELNDRNLESAVVMITYSGDGGVVSNYQETDWFGNVSDPAVNYLGGADNVWMDALEYELKKLSATAANRIYTGEVTPNTTLDEVKGKIILKVNYNTAAQASHMDVSAGIPALFSMWEKNDGPDPKTVDMRWGSPNPSVTPQLNWMFHEATHVGDGQEISWANKQSQILNIFELSVDTYLNNSAHDTWYMVDCGGTYYSGGAESNQNVIALTRDLNPIVERTLQERTQNASLGLVFFNFADKQESSGVLYGTNRMIQTVIDNNFKFNLRKKGDSSTNSLGGGGSSMGNGGNALQ